MTAQAVFSQYRHGRRRSGGFLLLPFTLFVLPMLLAASFVAYVLWPTWPSGPPALDAPALPVTVAGVLFEVPPAAIRAAVQRYAGPHQRIDLAFLWPSLKPPQPDGKTDRAALGALNEHGSGAPSPKAAAADAGGRLFVTITPLGSLPPPAERLRSIYPRYAEAKASAGADGLAILPFRAGSPYDGEDLIYFAKDPARFYARCTRQSGLMRSTCIQERLIGAADMTLRFPRDWLEKGWGDVAAGFDRLAAALHPLADGGKRTTDDR
jgi:hypothetical protein